MKKIFNIGITLIVTITTVILGAFVFRNSYLRLWETLKDLWLSVAYYFSLIFKGESNIMPTVNGFSNVLKASGYLPTTAEEFKRQIVKFFTTFIGKDNFISWLAILNNIAVKVSKGLVLIFSVHYNVVDYSEANLLDYEYKTRRKYYAFKGILICK